MFKSPFFYVLMAWKHNSTDAGNSAMPKRSHNVFPLIQRYVYIGKMLVYIYIYIYTHIYTNIYILIYSLVLSAVSGTHWGSCNVSPMDKTDLQYFITKTTANWHSMAMTPSWLVSQHLLLPLSHLFLTTQPKQCFQDPHLTKPHPLIQFFSLFFECTPGLFNLLFSF